MSASAVVSHGVVGEITQYGVIDRKQRIINVMKLLRFTCPDIRQVSNSYGYHFAYLSSANTILIGIFVFKVFRSIFVDRCSTTLPYNTVETEAEKKLRDYVLLPYISHQWRLNIFIFFHWSHSCNIFTPPKHIYHSISIIM